MKTDCAKRTEEVRSGFCNIGSGVSLKKTEMTSKSKELFFGVFFMFRLAEGGKKTRTAFDRIDYKTSRNAGNKMKTMNLPTAVNLLRRQLEEQSRQRRNTGIL